MIPFTPEQEEMLKTLEGLQETFGPLLNASPTYLELLSVIATKLLVSPRSVDQIAIGLKVAFLIGALLMQEHEKLKKLEW